MWKIVAILVAVISLGAAGYLGWRGHQAADDASAARTVALHANANAESLDNQATATRAKTRDANRKVVTINRAAGGLSTNAASVGLNLDDAAAPQSDIVATINPIVNHMPSAATRAHLADDLRQVDQSLAAADAANTRLRGTATALQKAAR